MPDFTITLQSAFFEYHPHASMILSRTGSLVLNAAARALFHAHQLPQHSCDDVLVHLLHPDDQQHWRNLHTSLPPVSWQYTWRWFVDPTVATALTTYVTLTEYGSCVVLEPSHSAALTTNSEDTAQMPQDDLELEPILEDIITTAQTLSHVHTSNDVPLEVALEHLPYAVFCVDKQWRFSFANALAAQALGTTPTDLLGRSLWEVAPELSQHAMGDHYRAAMTHGHASYHEVVAHDPPFTGRWHGTHLRPFADGLLITIKDITQRKRSEETLLAQKAYSDKLLAERNAILASIDDYFFILDKSWTITYANEAIAEYYGTLSAELIGQHLWDVTDLPAGHPILESYQRAMDSGQAQHLEATSSRHADMYIDVHIYPYENGLVVYGKDVSQRKRLKRHLQQALEEKEAILDSISDMMVCLASDWRITYINRRAQTFLSKKALGQYYFDLFPHNRGGIFEEKYQQVFDTQQPVTFEAQGSRSGRWLEHRVYPHQGGIVIYATDISERKRLEQELQRALQEREAIFDSITERVSVLDQDLRYVYVNKHARQLMPADPVGKTIAELLGNDTYDTTFERRFRAVFATGKPVQFEHVSPTDNTWRDIRIYPSGDGDTITVYSGDISERKKLEQDLRNALAQKDMLMKELHHRTKNNLQLVASMLALQARQLVDEGAKAALQNSQHRIRTLADIHSMLYRQDASTLDTASYLQLLADNVVKSTSRTPLRLEFQLDPLELPLEHIIALGLITNELITNALKHAFPEPSDADTIGLQLTSADNTVTFTLYNNGIALAEDRQDSLGMTIIAALSEQLGGDFELVNAPEGVVARVRFKA